MKFRELEDKLSVAQAQIDELTRKNKELEETPIGNERKRCSNERSGDG